MRLRLHFRTCSWRLHFVSLSAEPKMGTGHRASAVVKPRAALSMRSNGEVEGPHDDVGKATRAHTVFQRPRRQAAGASRTPPTIVRAHAVRSRASGFMCTLANGLVYQSNYDSNDTPLQEIRQCGDCSKPESDV